ncbi:MULTISPECIES: cobalamin-independent methionine synthase II family protein [Corynebacterium]|uniref:Cobalamin-independent methionine synthase II family protein n=1 Tax=Corynebacterium phoceense TaxID=1686286 RepID=A0A540RA76_9CORY|nr:MULTISPECIES: cobalamin-independent methionine synthase II family protein [Corynebacterium]KXB56071.1 methionine synthase, vitamin-B12 independent [Corynebacterium sp. DNF00584]MBF9010715.1 cobalamin-independent methionine synthase II family protein [Corynebacterium phoceense]OFL78805.1 methionine synthase [Corynebacterium sp. HMSC077B05]OFN44017.1 methionine synthase [Corynebacterium sp. HMSC072G08]OFP21215.1 methionine synthase [Corynebacterium sp. HMSC065A05]
MSQKIRTTHVGSLPRTPELLEANLKRSADEITDDEFFAILERAVEEVVQRQVDLGIDIINEGEYGHITSGAVDYGAWWNYSFSRLGGLTMTDKDRWEANAIQRSEPGNIKLTSFVDRRDRAIFNEAYNDPESGIFTGRKKVANPEFTGPITYIGQKEVDADVKLLKDAMGKAGASAGFVAALSPGSAARLGNKYYKTDLEVVQACGEALSHEYRAITDAGLTVQFDAPDLAEAWDQINPEPSVKDFQGFVRDRIAVLNDAIKDLPREQTRLHICWGSWHGPHVTDIPFADIIDEILEAKVGGFSFEGASPRHAHEWRVWQDHQLPEGTLIYPGVISHSTNAVEHPRLVADRIIQFAEVVGPENVVASTDCGLGGRLHHQIAWAKLESLVEGAQIATEELF